MFPLKLLIDAGVIAADYIHRQSKYIGCNDTELVKDAAAIAAHVYGNRSDIKLRNSWKVCRKNFGVVLEDRRNGACIKGLSANMEWSKTVHLCYRWY